MGASFEDLDAWKKSSRLAVKVYKLSKICHDYGLKDQMPRSAVAVPSNTAEGGERKTALWSSLRFLGIHRGQPQNCEHEYIYHERLALLQRPTQSIVFNSLNQY